MTDLVDIVSILRFVFTGICMSIYICIHDLSCLDTSASFSTIISSASRRAILVEITSYFYKDPCSLSDCA